MARIFLPALERAVAPGFRNALLAYCLFFLALTFPFWLQGEIISPYRQAPEIAASEAPGATQLENRKFSDYVSGYIPELVEVLHGPRSGWLGLWTTQNELGRPLDHTSGLSPAYFPSWLIATVTASPQRFVTVLSLSNCFLAGLFVLLLGRELRLSPLSGLLVAGSLAASPYFMYWLTFPMFTAAYCWSAGVLYAVTRLYRKHDLLGWNVLAFSIYSLLMTGYQQLIVFHAYILAGYVIYLTYRRWQIMGRRAAARWLVVVFSATVVGGGLALPMYLDLAYTASESARVAPAPSFFMANFPPLDSPLAILRFVALGTFPEIFGNPISPTYPLTYDGRSVTPLIIFLALLGLLLRMRETWGWWLAIGVLCLLLFIQPLYIFGVQYLGFNLSRSNPIGIILLPVAIVSAYGADALIQRAGANQHSRTVTIAVVGTLACLVLAVEFGITQELAVRWSVVALSLGVIGLLAVQVDRIRPALLIVALLVVASYLSFPMMLRQNASQLATSSLLVDNVRANLPSDSRYAVASPGLAVLAPNLNATLGLASIHSYNSLSSRRYHALIKALGGEVLTYGRWNGSIAPDYAGPLFWMSNIALMLSPAKLQDDNLDYLGQVGDVHFHGVVSRMGCCLQVDFPPDSIAPDGVQIADPRKLPSRQAVKTLDQGDLIELDVVAHHVGLLILSQKFHRDWFAQVRMASGWTATMTAPVNGIFQGVVLPEGTQQVRLQFKPFVRFAWLAHVFWFLVLLALGAQALRFRAAQPVVH